MRKIILGFLRSLQILIYNLKKLDVLSKNQTRLIAFTLSFFLTIWQLSDYSFSLEDIGIYKIAVTLFISFYIILAPFLYYFRYKLLELFSEHVFMAFFLIIYFIALVPVMGEIHKNLIPSSIDNFIIKFLHLLTMIVSISTILVIITRQFLLIIFNKRKIQGIDILMTFSTYLVVGLAFGTFYYLLNLYAAENLFSGVDKPDIFIFKNYLNHIYISLGALSTVASGSITASNPYMRLLSVSETILGVFLTSFSLGFVFAIVGSNIAKTNTELSNSDFKLLDFLDREIIKFKKDLENKERYRG